MDNVENDYEFAQTSEEKFQVLQKYNIIIKIIKTFSEYSRKNNNIIRYN